MFPQNIFIPDSDDKLISEKFRLLVKYGTGKKIQLNNETNLNKYKLELIQHLIYLASLKLMKQAVHVLS